MVKRCQTVVLKPARTKRLVSLVFPISLCSDGASCLAFLDVYTNRFPIDSPIDTQSTPAAAFSRSPALRKLKLNWEKRLKKFGKFWGCKGSGEGHAAGVSRESIGESIGSRLPGWKSIVSKLLLSRCSCYQIPSTILI